MIRTTISFTREGMDLIREAAQRQGSGVLQVVREATLMRARVASDKNPYPMRDLAEQIRAVGDQGYAGGEGAERRRGRGQSQAVIPSQALSASRLAAIRADLISASAEYGGCRIALIGDSARAALRAAARSGL